MKQFTTIKVGYTAGLYGNSGEYFTTVYVNDKGIQSFSFQGQYGAEDRIANALKEKGYKQIYTASDYGKMKLREVSSKLFVYERQALELIESI